MIRFENKVFKVSICDLSSGTCASRRRRLWTQSTATGAGAGSTSSTVGVRCRAQDREAAHQSVIDRHEGARVVEFTTVVGCTENGDQLAPTEELIAIFHDLVGSADEVDVIFLQELLDDGLAKRVADTTIIFAPARLALLRVRPEQVTEKAIFGHLRRACDLLELRNSNELRRQTTVHAEDLVIDEGSDRHAVEDVLEFFPDADRVATFAFIVEAIDAIDLATLVVAA